MPEARARPASSRRWRTPRALSAAAATICSTRSSTSTSSASATSACTASAPSSAPATPAPTHLELVRDPVGAGEPGAHHVDGGAAEELLHRQLPPGDRQADLVVEEGVVEADRRRVVAPRRVPDAVDARPIGGGKAHRARLARSEELGA